MTIDVAAYFARLHISTNLLLGKPNKRAIDDDKKAYAFTGGLGHKTSAVTACVEYQESFFAHTLYLRQSDLMELEDKLTKNWNP